MDIHWTTTYTAIVAAVISSSVLTVALEPVVGWVRKKRLYHGWQAVFLDNEHVYFGKVAAVTRDDIKLTNIYYLKDHKPAANYPLGTDLGFFSPTTIEVVKLGAELHAPEDTMIIGRSHILFCENLTPSAFIVRQIEKNESLNE